LKFLREVKEDDAVRFGSRLLDHDAKRINFCVEMFHAGESFLAASYESLGAHVAPPRPDRSGT
jgi:acyl-CoA thioesterase FadM